MTSSTSNTSAMNGEKLSGQLIIKAQLGDDIRKMMIHNEDLTLNELVLMMERVFAGKISNSDEITIKYLDDDGDKITLLNDSDLTVALHFHKCLRLFVFVNGKEQKSTNTTENVNNTTDLVDANLFQKELHEIRNSVQTILDRLQVSTNEVQPATSSSITGTKAPTPTIASSTTREFDPYKNLQQQQQQQPQQEQPSATPDSTQLHSNRAFNNEQPTIPSVDTTQPDSTNANKPPPTTFQQTQMPTPYFVPSTFNNEQQQQQQQPPTNVFGPPPTTFPPMPPLPTNPGLFPPATHPSSNASPTLNTTPTPPPPSSVGQPSGFIGQQAPPPPQHGGFYGQQQALFQQRPPFPNFNPSNAFAPPQTAPPPPASSAPATINPSFVQPPPMASQQPYGGYPPPNPYYNPAQQYPKSS